MAASGYTPILIYGSTTASNVPLAANLTTSASGVELAINAADGKLYFKNSSGVVTLLAGSGGGGPAAGSNTQIQFNSSGVFGASANLTWSGTVLSTTGLTATGAITLNTTTNNQSYTTTGAGTITISSGTTGSINNMTIGGTTAAAGTFTNLTYTGTLTGSTGVIAIGTNQIYKDSSGNVGIGTSSPSSKLDVRTAAGTSAVIGLNSGSNATQTKFSIGQIGSIDWDIGLSASAGNFYIGGLGGSMAEAYRITRTGTAIDYQTWNTGGSERMRIDSSGNVGIGTSTPSVKLEVLNNIKANSTTTIPAIISQSTQAAGYTPAQFQMYRVGASGGVTPDNSTIGEIRFDGSSLGGVYDNLGMIQVSGGVNATGGIPSTMQFYTATSGATATERMRIDSSGNVGIGTSSPSYNLHVRNGGGNGTIGVQYGTSTVTLLSAYAAQGDLQVTGANPLTFTNNSTERMRIDSSGNLLVGTTSAGGAGGVTIYPLGGGAGTAAIQVFNKTNTASDSAILFRVAGTTVSGISYTSTVVTYGTVSDYRLKTVVGAISDSGTRIDSLEPIEYTWNSNGQRARGFLAHKFQEVYASSVTGTKDAVDADGNPIHQGMQAGSTEVIADLVAEIQSLRKRLTALESKG